MLMMLKKRIPTILGIFLLLLGITAGVYLVEFGPQSLITRAGPEVTPIDVRITNISDSSFSVSWHTEANAIGFIKYSTSPSNLNLSSLDEREQSDTENRTYLTHYVTVSDLSPETTFYFVIVSGTSSSVYDDSGRPYSLTTAPSIGTVSVADAAYGSIYYPDLTPVEGALVYVNMEGGSTLSSLSGPSGTWAVPLSSMRNKDLSSYLNYDKKDATVNIEVKTPDGNAAQATTTTEKDTPVDDIILGKSYELSETESDNQEKVATSESQFSVDAFENVPSVKTEIVTLDNVNEGEAVNSQQPEFIGEGPPGTAIEITLESSDSIQADVTVNTDGGWTWAPITPLDPGEHTITLSWTDENGVVQTIRRRFTVFAQGESNLPAFEATPSATPTSLPSPTPTVLLLFTPTPSAIPTIIPSLTPTPTISIASEPAMPKPGTESLSVLILVGGMSTIILGVGYLLVYKKFD